jgi:thiol-disulfide isomerase/thioredoxin
MLASLAVSFALAQYAPSQPSAAIKLQRTEWPSIEGPTFQVPSAEAKATVLLFIAVDCPISNRYAPEYGRIHADYAGKGVEIVRVYIDDTVPKADIVKHADEFNLAMTRAIFDGKHVLVKALGVTVTPEAAVVGPDGTLLYRGRIDDLYVSHGRLREGEYRRDLREALTEIVDGKPVSVPFTNATGCGIPDAGDPR